MKNCNILLYIKSFSFKTTLHISQTLAIFSILETPICIHMKLLSWQLVERSLNLVCRSSWRQTDIEELCSWVSSLFRIHNEFKTFEFPVQIMNRRDLSHWDYEYHDHFDSFDQYNYQDHTFSKDAYDSYSNEYYLSDCYRNIGNYFQSPRAPFRAFNGNSRRSTAGRRNNQQSNYRNGQQTQWSLNNESVVEHLGYLEVASASNAEIPSKSTISKMALPVSNIVVNIVNINHEY